MSGPRRVERERIIRNLAARDGDRCFYCRTPFAGDTSPTLDHYVPRCLWPGWKQRNLVLACEPCNGRKANALPWTVAVLLLRNVQREELWRRSCGLAA